MQIHVRINDDDAMQHIPTVKVPGEQQQQQPRPIIDRRTPRAAVIARMTKNLSIDHTSIHSGSNAGLGGAHTHNDRFDEAEDDDDGVEDLRNVLYEYINPAMNILEPTQTTSPSCQHHQHAPRLHDRQTSMAAGAAGDEVVEGLLRNNNSGSNEVIDHTTATVRGGDGSFDDQTATHQQHHHYYQTIVVNGQQFTERVNSVNTPNNTSRRSGGGDSRTSSRYLNNGGMASTTSPAYLYDQAAHFRNYIWSFFQPAVDNKLALKLFGSASAIVREQERQNATNKWIVHPASNFRFYWDLMMLLLLLINLIVLPISISFFYNETLSIEWIVFNCLSDTIFIVDIGVNFRTGIMHPDNAAQVILDAKVIAKRYVKTWFFIDLLSSIPFDYLILITTIFGDSNNSELHQQVAQAGRAFRMLRLAKILSLMKLLRLSRLLRYVSQFEAVYFINLAGVFMRIFNFLALMLLLGHWSGCIQFMIPVLQGFPRDSWVVINELVDAPWFDQYTWALWQALSHMLCIGYGRFPPQNITDCWLTMCSMLTGAMSYALFIGHASNLIQSLDASRRNCREKWKQVEEYMAYRKLPRVLRRKIADYYDHRYQGKLFNEANILEELSDPLKEAIINFNCRELVKSVPFFTHADPNFVTAVIIKLHYEFFQPGDVIVRENTIGDKMYFIQEGVVEIFMGNNEPGGALGAETVITCLSDGSYFGEICLLTKAKRVASVRAQTYCSLFSLHSDNFYAVLEQYPLVRRTLESVAAERLNKIGKDPNIVSQRPDLPDDLKNVNELLEQVATLSRQPSTTNVHGGGGIASSSSKGPSQEFSPSDENAKNSKYGNSPSSHSHNKILSAFASGFGAASSSAAAKRRKKSLATPSTAHHHHHPPPPHMKMTRQKSTSTSDAAWEEAHSMGDGSSDGGLNDAGGGVGSNNNNNDKDNAASPSSAAHFKMRMLRAKLRSLSRTFSPGNSRRASRAAPPPTDAERGLWQPR